MPCPPPGERHSAQLSSASRSNSARMCASGLNMSMVPEDGADASTTVAHRTTHSASAYAHPPAAGGQPLPLLAQHQAFLATLQPAIQFANPASQSYGSEDVTHPPPWLGQPLPCILQHHSFFATLQPACQFAKPSAQL